MPINFLQRLSKEIPKLRTSEAAIALLWFHGLADPTASLSTKYLADLVERAGNARPNVTRFKQALASDRRTARAGPDSFKIKIGARQILDGKYMHLTETRPIANSSSVIPFELVKDTRKYIERVTLQLNASYDYDLQDCCSVMCRRLLETLIIEAYEAQKREHLIKDSDGNFLMFGGLLKVIETDNTINLGRNSKKGLKELKELGDKSAHNRRFNARKIDIDQIKADVRTAVEEILHIAKLA